MISHICLGITDYPRAFAFYARVMNALDLQLKFAEAERGWAGWVQRDTPRPIFVIGQPFDGAPATTGNGQMIALTARSRDQVDLAYRAAIEAGGQCEGVPGLRPHYHPDYYGAYFRDPDGNKLCVCCHAPPAT
ncbi:MAG: VOC family protein [Burkholderiales bacterium]|nr:VOC family protein [Burkholderiales bacterium]